MKKRLIILLFSICTSMLLIACGNKNTTSVNAKSSEQNIGAEPLPVEENAEITIGKDEEGAIR